MIDISKLSDTELNMAIIWCYPENHTISKSPQSIWYWYGMTRLDYLSDYNLTMPLAVEHELMIDLEPNSESGEYTAFNVIGDITGFDKNPLRAICEVLVQIAMEGK